MADAGDENEITQLLLRVNKGDDQAYGELLPLVYDELKRVAMRAMHGQSPGHTLQATALVNEACLKILPKQDPNWRNSGHFYAYAARAIRHILVDHARARTSGKHPPGGRLPLDSLHESFQKRSRGLDALDSALELLAQIDEQAVRIVELKFFAGLEAHEIAKVLGMGKRTVERKWRWARSWLRDRIEGFDDEP